MKMTGCYTEDFYEIVEEVRERKCYIVVDEKDGDLFTEDHEGLEEAIRSAERQWDRLTDREKDIREIYVLESSNADPEAEDHMDGDIVWRAKA